MTTTIVTATLNDLARFHSNGLYLWGTPGATNPYWANNASFMYDEIVANVSDFAEAAGYDQFYFEDPDMQAYLDVEGNTKCTIEVEMPEACEHCERSR